MQTLLAWEYYVRQNSEVIDIEDGEDIRLNSIENKNIFHKLNQINEPLEDIQNLHNENDYPDANNDDKLIENDGSLEEDN